MAERCKCWDDPSPPSGARCKLCGRRAPVRHVCHAEGCNTTVPPRMLMCLKHWRMVPPWIQRRVWREYVPGQEIRKDPTGEYLGVMKEAIDAVAMKEGRR